MRRAASLVLITLGIFGIALGLLLRFYAYPRLAVAPLDPHAISVAKGTGMTVFDAGNLKQRTNVTLTATRRIEGKLGTPDAKVGGHVALWAMGLVLEDDNNTVINAVQQWVCVDRRTADAVQPCSAQRVDDNANFHATGLNYKFPFNTQKHDYPFFDVTLLSSPPMHYDGEEKIDGLPVYRFKQPIAATKISDIEVPGDLVGLAPGTSVTAGRFYQNVRTVWVEPYTGAIIKGQEQVRQFLRGPQGQDGTILLDGTLTFTQDTVNANVTQTKKDRAKLQLLYDSGPRLVIGAGVLLALAGLVLLLVRTNRVPFIRSHRRGARYRPDEEPTQET